jgi:hypothetical protein
MLEGKFKTDLIKDIKVILPGCMVFHLDPTECQGIPDLLILYENTWAVLEGKRSEDAPHQPNQDYYVELMNSMSFAAFIYPENREEVLDALESTFRPKRSTRISRRI